ncbi:uncharacterized protein LOC112905213 [Agrilus planipennis]|nr:uncharacterized protein LOC112905213 [Agrilus planipennis]
MIIQDVPILPKRQSSCHENMSTVSGIASQHASYSIGGLSLFKLMVEDLSNYTTHSLNLTQNYSSTTICSEGSSFCCTFNVTINLDTASATNVVYKLVAFNGNRKLGTSTSGNQICGVVACLTDDILSCGQIRTLGSMIGVKFNSIIITGNFVNAPAGHTLPSTLTFSLTPIQNYRYCRTSGINEAQVNMNLTSPHDSIFAFGIFGRSFKRDGGSVGRSIATFNTICTVSVFFLTVLTVLQQKIIS